MLIKDHGYTPEQSELLKIEGEVNIMKVEEELTDAEEHQRGNQEEGRFHWQVCPPIA